jgi:proteasome lid subunit RPN8/RPN11
MGSGKIKEYKFLKPHLDKMIDAAIHAAADGGKEICGLLVDNGYFIELIQTKNKRKRGGGFAFYSQEVRSIEVAAEKLGRRIIGTFHSHPLSTAIPGESDLANAVDDSLMLIIEVEDKKAGLWHIKDQTNKEAQFILVD